MRVEATPETVFANVPTGSRRHLYQAGGRVELLEPLPNVTRAKREILRAVLVGEQGIVVTPYSESACVKFGAVVRHVRFEKLRAITPEGVSNV